MNLYRVTYTMEDTGETANLPIEVTSMPHAALKATNEIQRQEGIGALRPTRREIIAISKTDL